MKTKNKTMKRIVSLGLIVGILASVGIGAYLTSTETKQDVYTVGNVQAEIISNGDMELSNSGYLLPGTAHPYERAVKNTGINDAYVFMSITIPYEMVGVAETDGTQLGEFVRQVLIPGSIDGNIGSEWKLVDAGYIGEYEIEENGQYCGEHDTHSVAVGNTITYIYGYIGDNTDGALKALKSGETTSNLVDAMQLINFYRIDNIEGKVSTRLYAIQSDNVNGGLSDVNGVWAVINTALVGEFESADKEQIATYHNMITGVEFNALIPDEAINVEFVAMPQAYSLADRTAPVDAIDVSEAQDGSVMAWMEDTTFYVVAMDGGVILANADMSYMFENKINLASCNFDNLDFSNTTNSKSLFYGCENLKSIEIPKTLKIIGFGSFARTSLEIVTFEKGSQLEVIEEGAFASTKITEITIPANVVTIGPQAFQNSTLLNVYFENNSSIKTMEASFFQCMNLKSIVIPNGVENISDAFVMCSNLEVVEIPTTVTNIVRAFFNCTSLKIINYHGTEDQWNTITSSSDWNKNVPEDCVINFNYVPAN